MTCKEYEQAMRTLHAAAIGLITPNAARVEAGLKAVPPPKLTPLICECCGGQIDRATMRCKSCGTEYETESAKDSVKVYADDKVYVEYPLRKR